MAVISADDTSFQNLVEENDTVVVKYFADWCGSCKLFAPKFKRLALDEKYKGITFLDVNAEQNPEARKKGNVKNLPTFSVFKKGQFIESISSNKEEAVVELITKAII